jgi:cold shock CspA family protein/uncharacterized LabA/DUF88 family protein
MSGSGTELLRIGVFYDGQYFFSVSNYYNFEHPRKARISINGLHEFIRKQVSDTCNTDYRLCQIVDAHYFRGRLSARDAREATSDKLFNERVFDEILMWENVITHYMPLRTTAAGEKQEKGIDVWLALEAYELAIYKRFDVLVLIASDGDYVPLVRKLNTLGTRVMLLSWDFSYTDRQGKPRTTRTSQQLLEEVSYPIAMHQVIDDRVKGQDASVSRMFLPQKAYSQNEILGKSAPVRVGDKRPTDVNDETKYSTILSLKEGYGFISDPKNNNVFFHHDCLENADFNTLKEGQKVGYTLETTSEGKLIAVSVWAIND